MVEIQCSSCHTRYRIDERVLPPETPTFKCSRCGHVFTTDPLTAKKVTTEAPARPQASRPAASRSEPKVAPPSSSPSSSSSPAWPTASKPEAASEPRKPAVPDEPSPFAKAAAEQESKPAPIKPYIRNQRPTVFDRAPEPPAPKSAADFADEIDSDAVAMMKASVEEPKPAAVAEPPRKADPQPLRQPEPAALREPEGLTRKPEPPRAAPPSSRAVKNNE